MTLVTRSIPRLIPQTMGIVILLAFHIAARRVRSSVIRLACDVS